MPRPLVQIARSKRAIAAIATVVLLIAASSLLVGAEEDIPDVRTQDAIVDVPERKGSPDRIQLDVTLYVPEDTPAPAVLLPHGFGGTKNSVARDARELAERGFVVLTYTARGFGRSTGSIALNDPAHEVSDASHLLDYLAAQPTVTADESGDPLVAVTGASYAGALALLLAGTDERVDAIAPVMTYNDLGQALLPNGATAKEVDGETPAEGVFGAGGVFKRGWAGNLFAGGMGGPGGQSAGPDAPEPGVDPDDVGVSDPTSANAGTGGTPAIPGSSGIRPGSEERSTGTCGRFTPQVCAAYTELATGQEPSDRTLALLERVSPASVTDRIKVPTLLVQGEQDTLFGLDHADKTAREITSAGGDVQMVWYAGGHDGGGPGPKLRGKIADWLSFRLSGDGDNPLPAFSYDVQGAFQATRAPSVRVVEAERYPGLDQDKTERRRIGLGGPAQTIMNPPGGAPSAISGIPGLNALARRSSTAASMFGIDLPGQFAQFVSPTLKEQLVIAGAPTVRLRVSAAPPSGADQGGSRRTERDAVLFVKLYDITADGRRTLPGNAVAPIRVPALRAGDDPVEVTVALPGIVRPVDAGHRIAVVVATTDQSYAGSVEPAAFQVSVAGGNALSVPVVPGSAAGGGVPIGPVVGIGVVLLLAGAVTALGALRRRRERDVDPELATTPLVIRGLTKSYPGGVTAVSDLSFRVERGQVLGLLGPNGAGKTTTLRMLMGLVNPSDGEMRVFGHRVYPGAPVLSRIGSFVEGSGFLPHLSGAANLRLYWASTGRPEERAHFNEALEIAGLGNAIDRKVRTYSQGMRQRLAIAQAMLGLPELLVLDEPTNGLDPPQIHQMREVLRRYAATGRTVLVSSHLLAEVEQTSTHVVVMHRGKVVADGAVGEIVAAGGEATFVVDRPGDAASALRALDGVSGVETDGRTVHANLDGVSRAAAVAALVNAGVAVEQAGPRRRLEDAFLRLVGEP